MYVLGLVLGMMHLEVNMPMIFQNEHFCPLTLEVGLQVD